MASAFPASGSGSSTAARYSPLLQKLESSCVTCTPIADKHTLPLSTHEHKARHCSPQRYSPDDCSLSSWQQEFQQISSTLSPSRGLSNSGSCSTADTSCCGASSAFLASYAPRCSEWCTPLADAGASSSPSPLFVVHIHHPHRRRREGRVRNHRNALSAHYVARLSPNVQQTDKEGQTPLSGTATPAITPTADDYLCHYLTQYRRRSTSALAADAQESGHLHAGVPTGGATPVVGRERCRALCLATPACSPILAVSDTADGGYGRDVDDAPDVVCRLFASASTEADETRWQ